MAARVNVPEAALDVDDLAELGEHQVQRARQVPAVQPEAVAEPVREPADKDLRRRVTRPHRRYDLRPLGPRGLLCAPKS